MEVKEKLKKLFKEAFEKNIFGAPTYVVNKKNFWGQDRFEYALEELNLFLNLNFEFCMLKIHQLHDKLFYNPFL